MTVSLRNANKLNIFVLANQLERFFNERLVFLNERRVVALNIPEKIGGAMLLVD